MAIFDMIRKSIETRDIEAYLDLFHDDYEFVRHRSGTVMKKREFAEMMRGMMSSDAVKIDRHRLIYENGDVLVEHSVMDFPDGTREAVLEAHTLKDGKIVRTETGATTLEN